MSDIMVRSVNQWLRGGLNTDELIKILDRLDRPWGKPGVVPTEHGWYEVYRKLVGVTPAQLTRGNAWMWWGRSGSVKTAWVTGRATNQGWQFRPYHPAPPSATQETR